MSNTGNKTNFIGQKPRQSNKYSHKFTNFIWVVKLKTRKIRNGAISNSYSVHCNVAEQRLPFCQEKYLLSKDLQCHSGLQLIKPILHIPQLN